MMVAQGLKSSRSVIRWRHRLLTGMRTRKGQQVVQGDKYLLYLADEVKALCRLAVAEN